MPHRKFFQRKNFLKELILATKDFMETIIKNEKTKRFYDLVCL